MDSTTHWDRFEAELRWRGDEEALVDWHAAVETDQKDPDAWARTMFIDDYLHGGYRERRKNKLFAKIGPNGRSEPAAASAPSTPAQIEHPVGRQVAAERSRAGLTQAELADAAGMRRERLSKIERGLLELRFREACRIADAVGSGLDAFRVDALRVGALRVDGEPSRGPGR
ncbi:MAG TPA: helix-turn-helix transcriptional regulator [Actinomycetota bacterium]